MNCENTNGGGTEVASLPLLSGCPADHEFIMVGNAVGGKGTYKYARRRLDDLKACIGRRHPLIGVVGGGTAKDPIAGQSIFQHDDLIDLGSANMDRAKIEIDGVSLYNFGTNIGFYLNSSTGTIDLDVGNSNQWVDGSGLYIDLNQ